MKTISVALQAHKQGGTTTLCMLLRLTSVGGTNYGFASLDQDVTYDDGSGSLVYKARRGFTPAKTSSNESLSVDNTDLMGLVADVLGDGLTAELIHAGEMSFAQVRVMQVNYNDLTMGHENMLRGSIGEVTLQGGQYTAEFRSLTQQLKQQLLEPFSLKCRAQFGDSRCTFNVASLLIDGTVTAVGVESDLIFVDTSLTQADDYFVPGRVQWLTGDNAGAHSDIEAFSAGEVTLLMPLFYPIQVGDTYKIRQDCAKTVAACKGFSNIVNMRAEPYIPVGDAATVSTPGAQIGQATPGSSGDGTQPS